MNTEVEANPLVLQDDWDFQDEVPAHESHYSLQLPPAWEYKVSFLNYPEVRATQSGSNQWQWMVTDVKAIREENRCRLGRPGGKDDRVPVAARRSREQRLQ